MKNVKTLTKAEIEKVKENEIYNSLMMIARTTHQMKIIKLKILYEILTEVYSKIMTILGEDSYDLFVSVITPKAYKHDKLIEFDYKKKGWVYDFYPIKEYYPKRNNAYIMFDKNLQDWILKDDKKHYIRLNTKLNKFSYFIYFIEDIDGSILMNMLKNVEKYIKNKNIEKYVANDINNIVMNFIERNGGIEVMKKLDTF